jgi:hypothetical protein
MEVSGLIHIFSTIQGGTFEGLWFRQLRVMDVKTVKAQTENRLLSVYMRSMRMNRV